MFPSTIRSAPTVLRQPIAAAGMRPLARPSVMAKRFQQLDNRGGKSKLAFRVGLKDVPVELYPMGFVVLAAATGAIFAIGRHFYLDGLRVLPTGKKSEGQ